MKDWEITSFDDIGVGNIVEFVCKSGCREVRKTGTVTSIRTIQDVGPALGHIELYVAEHGLVTASATTEIEVYR